MGDRLFAMIPRPHIEDILDNLRLYTGVKVHLIDTSGETIAAYGQAETPCTPTPACRALQRKSGERALALGGAYIFACPMAYTHIAYPLIRDGELLGTVLIGPFLMNADEAEEARLPLIEPERVTALSRLVNYTFQSILPAERAILLRSYETLSGQSRINEAIQMYKNQALPATYDFFYRKERELLSVVRTGDVKRAKALMNELLGHVLFSEGWNVAAARLRAIELTTLLSRVAMEGGAQSDAVFALNERFLSLISRREDIEGVSMLLLEVVESFMDAMFNSLDKGNLHIRRALRYIAAHYAQPLRVSDVAKALGLNADYFAALFRSTVGEPFPAYLSRVRIERSKELLLSTDNSITDIALAMGFSDQSYFCRVFKQLTGVSPGKYRR